MRFMRPFIKEVFASHCTGLGIVLSSPVSGMDPGSKAIDAIELPAWVKLAGQCGAALVC